MSKTNSILDGITLAIREAYPNSKIECDTVKQELIPPAFIVTLVNAGVRATPNKQWQCAHRFDVIYFPKEGREECYDIANRLAEILEVITLPSGDKLRGSDMTFEVDDGVLHVLISYNISVYKKAEDPTIEVLEIKQGG